MRFGSLFSGIGGFDAGLERASMKCAWQVEKDRDCNKILKKHWPKVKRYGDITRINPADLEPVELLCGGFPCQDLSVAGKRKGLAGERSGLWFQFLRIASELTPEWILVENVPGLLSSDDGRDMAIIVQGLVELGYCVCWRVFDAQYDGVAQRRRRVFIVGSFRNGRCAEVLFEPESVRGDSPPSREARAGVTPILEAGARTNGDGYRDGDGIGVEGDPMFTLQSGKQHAVSLPDVAWCLQERDAKGSDSDTKEGHLIVADTLTSGIGIKGNAPGRRREDDTNLIAATLKGSGGQSRGWNADDGAALITHALRSEGADASEDGTGRGTPLVVANCFNGYTGGADDNDGQANHIVTAYRTAGNCGPFEQGDKTAALNTATDPFQQVLAASFGVRRLTPTECERLQGFPDGWTAGMSDSARYRMLGNAVVPAVAYWIGRRIMSLLGEAA